MTPQFKRALSRVKRIEGGFNDVPQDKGGPTNLGISFPITDAWIRQKFNRPATVEDVKALTPEVAEEIYYSIFWQSPRTPCQKLAEWWEPMGMLMFDCEVNHRPLVAGRILQNALNILNRNEKAWDDMKVDGLIGPKTLGILKDADSLPRWRERLMVACCSYRLKLVIDICEYDPTQEEFAAGWMFRTAGYVTDFVKGG